MVAFDMANLSGWVFDFLHGDLLLEKREYASPVGTGDRPVGLVVNGGPERGMFQSKALGLRGSAAAHDVAGCVVPDVSIADVGTTVFLDFPNHPIRHRKPKLGELVSEVSERGWQTSERAQNTVVQIRVEGLVALVVGADFNGEEIAPQRSVPSHHDDGGLTLKRGLVVVL